MDNLEKVVNEKDDVIRNLTMKIDSSKNDNIDELVVKLLDLEKMIEENNTKIKQIEEKMESMAEIIANKDTNKPVVTE